jgi:NADPH-dependent 7-cyano-7-deazaguanine reductase QueF
MSPRSVGSGADVQVTATADLQHLCPFVDEVDHGTITIAWHCNGATLELHSLREYLDGFKDSELSHEALTDLIRHDLSVIARIDLISVTTTWQTAGMEVTCSTSPTPVGRK